MLTTIVTGFPLHPLIDGVTVYVTVPAAALFNVNVCAIWLPFPDVAPLVPFSMAVQLNVVPARLDDNAMAIGSPSQ